MDQREFKIRKELADKKKQEVELQNQQLITKTKEIDNKKIESDLLKEEEFQKKQEEIKKLFEPFPDIQEWQNWNNREAKIKEIETQLECKEELIKARIEQLKNGIQEKSDAFKEGLIPNWLMNNFIKQEESLKFRLKKELEHLKIEKEIQRIRLNLDLSIIN